MADKTRAYLRQEFSDGERPSGNDFRDLIDSFINKEDDSVRFDADNNLGIPNGLNVGDATQGQVGTLRFNGGQLQIFDGGAWNPVSGGGGGAFQPVGGGQDVAYDAGNVGIGTFAPAPTHRLEVDLPANNAADQSTRVRIGQLSVHNGTDNAAYVGHASLAGNNNRFALRQDDQGNTTVNTRTGAQLVLAQENTSRIRISTQGELILTPSTATTMGGDIRITGNAFKPGGGPWQNSASDIRTKKDVRQLDAGLTEINQLTPVFYKHNDKIMELAGETEYVGLIAQDVEKVLPFIVSKSPIPSDENEDLLTYDSGPLTFILVKAVQELSTKVEKLEKQLKEMK